MTTHINRLKCSISNAPGVSGALTITAAASGFRTFGAAHDGMSVDCLLLDGTAWEVRTGCVYTHATTSLSRGTLEDSSTTAAIDLTSATQVLVTMSAGMGNALEMAMQAVTPGGRLTLESGVPISTTDQIAKTTIYYTPFVHNTVPLWDGAKWVPTTFTETSLALGTLTSGKPYDVFAYLSSGSLALEMLAWTNDTTRATDVILQDGRYCKSGDKTRLLLGTFYTTSTTTTEDSGFGSTTYAGKRYVWNAYNRVRRALQIEEDTTSWTYTGSSVTWRQWRNATDNQVNAVVGLPGKSTVSLEINSTHTVNALYGASSIGVGFDSVTALAPACMNFYGSSNPAGGTIPQHGYLEMTVPIGHHYWSMIEENITGANVMTAYGTNVGARRCGMVGSIDA